MSNVRPRILGVFVKGMGVLFSVMRGCSEDSFLSEVIRVTDDFSDEAVILLVCSHSSNWPM